MAKIRKQIEGYQKRIDFKGQFKGASRGNLPPPVNLNDSSTMQCFKLHIA